MAKEFVVGEAKSILQTSDGGYIIVGDIPWHAWVIKLDGNGELIWHKQHYGGDFDSVQETGDCGYIIAGMFANPYSDTEDFRVLKIDSNGNVEWEKSYGDIDHHERAYSIQQTFDGGYIVAGRSASLIGNTVYAWILKLSNLGNVEWQKKYGTGYGESVASIQQTPDGGYIAVGVTHPFGQGDGNADAWILKLANNGDVAWQRTFGSDGYDAAHSVQQIADGGYIIAGETPSINGYQGFILKLNKYGEIPNCSFLGSTNTIANNTSIKAEGSSANSKATSTTISETTVKPQDAPIRINTICLWIDADADDDGISDEVDDCPNHYNPSQEDADGDSLGNVCDNCPNHYNPEQLDTYPPQGNCIGDVCDCEGNFDCDQDVDAADVSSLLTDFGRGTINRPCTNSDPCNGDFDCDGDVDAEDVTRFLEDFGRSQYNNPCPACNPGISWCNY